MPDSPQSSSPAYKRADSDSDFLQRDELRAARLQLEWLKSELIHQDEGIESTIVVFGSARLVEPVAAQAKFTEAAKNLAQWNVPDGFGLLREVAYGAIQVALLGDFDGDTAYGLGATQYLS